MTDRQVINVARAIRIARCGQDHDTAFTETEISQAEAAIEASDAKYMPMLVEALLIVAADMRDLKPLDESICKKIESTLEQLPEEYKK